MEESTAANGTDELLPECHRPHSSAQLGKFMLHGLSSFRWRTKRAINISEEYLGNARLFVRRKSRLDSTAFSFRWKKLCLEAQSWNGIGARDTRSEIFLRKMTSNCIDWNLGPIWLIKRRIRGKMFSAFIVLLIVIILSFAIVQDRQPTFSSQREHPMAERPANREFKQSCPRWSIGGCVGKQLGRHQSTFLLRS